MVTEQREGHVSHELVPALEDAIIYRGFYHLKETNFSAKNNLQSQHAQANINWYWY